MDWCGLLGGWRSLGGKEGDLTTVTALALSAAGKEILRMSMLEPCVSNFRGSCSGGTTGAATNFSFTLDDDLVAQSLTISLGAVDLPSSGDKCGSVDELPPLFSDSTTFAAARALHLSW